MQRITTTHEQASDLLTRQEASKYLGVSLMTLHRWARKGYLVPARLGERVVRYRAGDIEQFINGERAAK